MIVYFSASARSFEVNIGTYRKILNTVHALGHTFANNWVEAAYHRSLRGDMVGGDIKDIVRSADIGMQNAELVIAEVSGASTFGVGYEVAKALHYRKPTLLLMKKSSRDDSYAIGVENDLITRKLYTVPTLEKVVEDFIRDNTVKNKDLRFNFVIDRKIYNHLRLKAFRTKKTKGEILRELLLQDLDRDPED